MENCHTTRPRVLLVESEPVQAKLLTSLMLSLNLCPLGPVTTATEALELCRYDWPELAILDVQLPGAMDGIELATQLAHLGSLPLVFLCGDLDDTALLERIAQTQPLALLTKPYQTSVLQQIISQGLALGSSLAPVALPTPPPPTQEAAVAEWNMPLLYVRERGMLVRLAVSDIACVHMSQQYAVLNLISGHRHSVRMTLAELRKYLPGNNFVQCHRSWVVNIDHIERLDPTADVVWLTGGAEATLGRAYRHQVLQRLHILG